MGAGRVLDGVFIDGKTEKEGLRQGCPVFCHIRGDVKTKKKIWGGISQIEPISSATFSE